MAADPDLPAAASQGGREDQGTRKLPTASDACAVAEKRVMNRKSRLSLGAAARGFGIMARRNSLPNSISALRLEQSSDSAGSSSSTYPLTPPLSPGAKFRTCPALARHAASANHGAERQLDGKSSLLSWCADQLSDHVAAGRVPPVVDFGPSWRDGRAFLGLLNSYRAELVPNFEEYVSELGDQSQPQLPEDARTRWRYRLALAFTIAEKRMNIPRLLEPEDLLDVDIPDEKGCLVASINPLEICNDDA
ncbi:MAG: hypothetical protein BJ554DRAFT_5395 [Olpidium bornovanus]|uniref:Calponin-homology (CH) domain-containing protein n=1 Tax=Olpidium bornovanus TaxID=278681 RepID=A0A8H7ZZA0_9FUNG|nr:MAG: hypothetical protein BJ554DRAFT_5395 [Olpidium bornovanus]